MSDTLFAITFTLLSGKYILNILNLIGDFPRMMLKKISLIALQETFEDSVEYVNIFNRKFAQNDSLVQVAHHELQTPCRRVHRVVQIRVNVFPVISAR